MNNQIHLSEEQIYDLLDHTGDPSGVADSAAQLHLAVCSACRSEVASLRISLSTFKQATTGMALAQAPSSPPRRTAPEATSRNLRPVWGFSLATAAVLMAAAVAVFPPHAHPPIVPAPTADVQVASSESDEALLEGIQRDLSTSVPPSLEPLAVPAAPSAAPITNSTN